MRITCCVSLLLVALLTPGCDQLDQLREKPILDLMYSGRAVSGVFSNEFVFKVWHHHPGTVHNGSCLVYSVDAWPPSEENARTFKFKIDQLGPDLQIRFEIEVQTAETKELDTFAIWTDSNWDAEARSAELRKKVEEAIQSLEDEHSAAQ